jgi:hypothetical protein
MAYVCNLSPSHRPPQPSLNNGPVQRRVRRAFVATGQSVLSTTQIIARPFTQIRMAWPFHWRCGISFSPKAQRLIIIGGLLLPLTTATDFA